MRSIDCTKPMFNQTDDLETFSADDLSDPMNYEMKEWQEDESEKVFILTETKDYEFIQSFFRFIEYNNLQDRSIIYGITDWNHEILHTYLNNYNVRLTSFFNPDMMVRYNTFTESFFSMMHTFPQENAYEGYGHGLLVGDFLSELGRETPVFRMKLDAPGFRARLVDHNELVHPGSDRPVEPSYWENEHLYLLEFDEYRYKEVDH